MRARQSLSPRPPRKRPQTPRADARRSRRAYTVVEVMMSLGILALGAVGVVALQKVTLISNSDARNRTTATAIAQSWMERLRTDAIQWNKERLTPGASDDLGETIWLKQQQLDPQWYLGNPVSPKGWFSPTSIQKYATSDADLLGASFDPGDDPALRPAFCTQIRLTDLNSTGVSVLPRLMRVEVRTFWERAGRPADCTIDSATFEQEMKKGRFGYVYLVSAVLQNVTDF
jgi:hypothetical protein